MILIHYQTSCCLSWSFGLTRCLLFCHDVIFYGPDVIKGIASRLGLRGQMALFLMS